MVQLAAAPTGSLTGGSVEVGQVIPTQVVTGTILTSSGTYTETYSTGSLLISSGTLTSTIADTYAQMIRTGTGDITIDSGGSVYLMNQLATIYTAGTLDSSTTINSGNFNSPTGSAGAASDASYVGRGGVYGVNITPGSQYAAQYTTGGGNVTINAGQDIAHVTESAKKSVSGSITLTGTFVADTSWQFPTNWLYRRGATRPDGAFDSVELDVKGRQTGSEIASTTWWIDFSNFFEGIGALGGGNVSLKAGNNIINVDAVIPTNERTTFTTSSGDTLAADQAEVELGGGDLTVIAGNTLEGRRLLHRKRQCPD